MASEGSANLNKEGKDIPDEPQLLEEADELQNQILIKRQDEKMKAQKDLITDLGNQLSQENLNLRLQTEENIFISFISSGESKNETITKLKDRLMKLEERYGVVMQLCKRLKLEIKDHQSQKRAAAEEKDQLKREIEELKSENIQLEKKLSDLQEDSNAQLTEMTEKLKTMEETHARRMEEKERLHQSALENQQSAMLKQIQGHLGSADQTHSERVRELKKAQEKTLQEKIQLETQLADLTEKLKSMEETYARQMEEKERLYQSAVEEQHSTMLKQIQEQQGKVEHTLSQRVRELQKAQENTLQEKIQLETQLADLTEKLKTMEETCARQMEEKERLYQSAVEEQHSTMLKQIQEQQGKVEHTLSQRVRELQKAQENTLQEKIQLETQLADLTEKLKSIEEMHARQMDEKERLLSAMSKQTQEHTESQRIRDQEEAQGKNLKEKKHWFSLTIGRHKHATDIEKRTSKMGFRFGSVASTFGLNLNKEYQSVKDLIEDLRKIYILLDYHEEFTYSDEEDSVPEKPMTEELKNCEEGCEVVGPWPNLQEERNENRPAFLARANNFVPKEAQNIRESNERGEIKKSASGMQGLKAAESYSLGTDAESVPEEQKNVTENVNTTKVEDIEMVVTSQFSRNQKGGNIGSCDDETSEMNALSAFFQTECWISKDQISHNLFGSSIGKQQAGSMPSQLVENDEDTHKELVETKLGAGPLYSQSLGATGSLLLDSNLLDGETNAGDKPNQFCNQALAKRETRCNRNPSISDTHKTYKLQRETQSPDIEQSIPSPHESVNNKYFERSSNPKRRDKQSPQNLGRESEDRVTTDHLESPGNQLGHEKKGHIDKQSITGYGSVQKNSREDVRESLISIQNEKRNDFKRGDDLVTDQESDNDRACKKKMKKISEQQSNTFKGNVHQPKENITMREQDLLNKADTFSKQQVEDQGRQTCNDSRYFESKMEEPVRNEDLSSHEGRMYEFIYSVQLKEQDVTVLNHIIKMPSKHGCFDVIISCPNTSLKEACIIIVEGPDSKETFKIDELMRTILTDKNIQHDLIDRRKISYYGEKACRFEEERHYRVRAKESDLESHKFSLTDSMTSKRNKNEGTAPIKQSFKRYHGSEMQSASEMRSHGSAVDPRGSTARRSGHESSLFDRAETKHKDIGFRTKNKSILVKVMKADITELLVDVIVNAANRRLKHGGGVAKAIAIRAGRKLEQECDEYVKRKPLQVTELFVSTGGNLSASYVFHAVGPKWCYYEEGKRQECARDLRFTVLRCLVEAEKRNLHSIAIPSISAAIFKVPLEICTKAYLQAVQIFDSLRKDDFRGCLEEISFVDIADDMVREIHHYFSSHWHELPGSYVLEEGNTFAIKHLESSRRGQSSGPTNTKKSHHQSGLMGGNVHGKSHQPKIPSSDLETQVFLSNISVSVSADSAFDPDSDLVCFFGDLPSPNREAGVYIDEDVADKNQCFRTYGLRMFTSGKPHKVKVGQIYLDDDRSESVAKGFERLHLNLGSCLNYTSLNRKYLVFTSSCLLKGTRGSRMLKIHQEAFTDNLFKLLIENEHSWFQGRKGHVRIAVGRESLADIINTLGRLNQSQSGAFSRDPAIESPQPQRSVMTVTSELHYPHNAYKITYSILDPVVSEKLHQHKTLEAYLVETSQGNQVLHMLKVAFWRGLIFTTVKSSRHGLTLEWKDITHKSSFGVGGSYNSDYAYLEQVTSELKSKGVTEDSFTRLEKDLRYPRCTAIFYGMQ